MLGPEQYPVLREFYESRARVSVITGPLGSGKTYVAVQRMLMQMCEQAPNAQGERLSRWLCVRNTYPDLMGTTYRDFRAVFGELGKMKMGGLEPPTYTVDFRLPNEDRVHAEVIFLALDREGAVKKLRGYQLTGVWFNELKELQKAVVDMADARHGRYPSLADGGVRASWHGMLGDTNAPDEDHWLYELAEIDRPEGWHFARQPGGVTRARDTQGKPVRDANGRQVWDVNEAAENNVNLPDGYYPTLIRGKADAWIAVNAANEYGFVVDGKPIYPEYRDDIHFNGGLVYDPRYPLVLGFDFGRTPAMAVLQYIDTLDRWHVLDEFCAQDMSASVFGPQARRYLDREYPRWEAGTRGWGDPAGDHSGQTLETTPIELLVSHGLPVQPTQTNVYALRHAALSSVMTRLGLDGRPALQVGPKARMIRKGLQGAYCYRKLKVTGSERYTDEPDKNAYSHPVEALQYAVQGGGEGRAVLRSRVVQRGGRGRPTQAVME